MLFAWGSKHSVDSDSGGFWIEFDGPGKIFQQCSNRISDSREYQNRSFLYLQHPPTQWNLRGGR